MNYDEMCKNSTLEFRAVLDILNNYCLSLLYLLKY